MRKRLAQFRKLSRTSSHKWAMLRNMVTSLIQHERIVTTLPKAKELRTLAEKVVGYAKKEVIWLQQQQPQQSSSSLVSTTTTNLAIPSLLLSHQQQQHAHSRQQAFQIIRDKPILTKLFTILGPRYMDRNGGYTRIMKLSQRRKGDNAPMALLEYVDRIGEIRAARVPKVRKERFFLERE